MVNLQAGWELPRPKELCMQKSVQAASQNQLPAPSLLNLNVKCILSGQDWSSTSTYDMLLGLQPLLWVVREML